jgi:predicted anti-sigma-YlaC factor YlaD
MDDELAPVDRRWIAEHLSGCGPCRDFLAILKRNEDLIASALNDTRRATPVLSERDAAVPLAAASTWERV